MQDTSNPELKTYLFKPIPMQDTSNPELKTYLFKPIPMTCLYRKENLLLL